MGEGTIKINRGDRVDVELRNVGAVKGTVAWVQDQRFGVAFDEEIDSQSARAPQATTENNFNPATELSRAHRAPAVRQTSGNLRKI